MTVSTLRCHLLIGAPGSGKTTLAQHLAPLLRGPQGEPGLILSTDVIRAELYGDASVQGPWDEIRGVMLERLNLAVAAGTPVIIDATHARRSWRLLYTQVLELPQPVEWIGWWLTTKLEQCKAWALLRDRPVPEAVIEDFYSSINHRIFKPERAEGFATVIQLDPAAGEASGDPLASKLESLDGSIRNALNRQRAKEPYFHRYSRLLDLERLLFLIRLLSSFNGLDVEDPGTAAALLGICNPPPVGDLAQRAAAYLVSWKEVHGGNSEGYGDVTAIRADLQWLEDNYFFCLDWRGDQPIELGDSGPVKDSSVHGGYPALADQHVFRRVFTLLRHILKEPFDSAEVIDKSLDDDRLESKRLAEETSKLTQALASRDSKTPRKKRESSDFGPLYKHLMAKLSTIAGSYGVEQEAALRYDVEHVLRAYGFLAKVKGRPNSVRQGYAIGTALLSADQLLETHALLKASLERLSDASHRPLLESLQDRLIRAGILAEDGEPNRTNRSKRVLANRSFTEAKLGTLAHPDVGAQVERAIHDRRRIWLRHRPDLISEDQKKRRDDGRFRAWPLQLLFHNISWYLAFETWEVGRPVGLIRCLRLDRLELISEDGNARHSELEHGAAMERLQRLQLICGGLYFGQSIDAQLAVTGNSSSHSLTSKSPVRGDPKSETAGLEHYERLRFCCTPLVFGFIREEPLRFAVEHTAYAKPIPGLPKLEASPLDVLEPNPMQDSHPYPVELLLPHWTVHEDWDLRSWLFRWGAGIRIESPVQLREVQRLQAQGVVDLYGG